MKKNTRIGNLVNKWWGVALNLAIGVFNLVAYLKWSHNPWSLMSSGFAFGAAMGLVFNEFMRDMYKSQSNFHRDILTKQQNYIGELERILNDVAQGRATVSVKPRTPVTKVVN